MDRHKLPESIIIATNTGGFTLTSPKIDTKLRTNENFSKGGFQAAQLFENMAQMDNTLTHSPHRNQKLTAAAQVDLGTLKSNQMQLSQETAGVDHSSPAGIISFDLEQGIRPTENVDSPEAFGRTGFSKERVSLHSTQNSHGEIKGEENQMHRKYGDSKMTGWQEPKIMTVRRDTTSSPDRESGLKSNRGDDASTDRANELSPDLMTPVPIPFSNEAVDKFMNMNIRTNAYELKQLRDQAMKAHEVKMERYVNDAESRARKSFHENPLASKAFSIDSAGVISSSPTKKKQQKSKRFRAEIARVRQGSRDMGAGNSHHGSDQHSISATDQADSQYLDPMQYSSNQLHSGRSPNDSKQNLVVSETAILRNPHLLRSSDPYMSGIHDFRIKKERYYEAKRMVKDLEAGINEGQNIRMVDSFKRSVNNINKARMMDKKMTTQVANYEVLQGEPIIVERKDTDALRMFNKSMDSKIGSFRRAVLSQQDGGSPRPYGQTNVKKPLHDLLKNEYDKKRKNQRSVNSFLDEVITPYMSSAHDQETSTKMSLKIQNSRYARDSKKDQYLKLQSRAATELRDSVFDSVDTNRTSGDQSKKQLYDLYTQSKFMTGRTTDAGMQSSFSKPVSPQVGRTSVSDISSPSGRKHRGSVKLPMDVKAPLKMSPREMEGQAIETYSRLSRASETLGSARIAKENLERQLSRNDSGASEKPQQRSFSVMGVKPEVDNKPYSVKDMARIIRKQAKSSVYKPSPTPYQKNETLMKSVESRQKEHDHRRNKTMLESLCKQIELGKDHVALPDVFKAQSTAWSMLDTSTMETEVQKSQPQRVKRLTAGQRKHRLMEQQKGRRLPREFPHHKVEGKNITKVRTYRNSSDYEMTERFNQYASALATPIASVITAKTPFESSMIDSGAITEESHTSFDSSSQQDQSVVEAPIDSSAMKNMKGIKRSGPSTATGSMIQVDHMKQTVIKGENYTINNKDGRFMKELDGMIGERQDIERGREQIRQSIEDANNKRAGRQLRQKRLNTQG